MIQHGNICLIQFRDISSSSEKYAVRLNGNITKRQEVSSCNASWVRKAGWIESSVAIFRHTAANF